MYQAISHIDSKKRLPKRGNHYLVPYVMVDNERLPVIDHLHNDKENGQGYQHYHVDTRFSANISGLRINFDKSEPVKARLGSFKCLSRHHGGITDVNDIAKSKLKHDCIYKGKCPHRGYDLSNVVPINGVITCPLHGLKFDGITGKIITI